MKKITLSLFMLAGFLGFSQDNIGIIKNHLAANLSKSSLTNQDISDLVITNDFTNADGDVLIYHVKQKINGIEVYTSDSNFLIKNGEVISGDGKNFEKNISQKTNALKPSLSITDALSRAITGLNEKTISNVQVLEKKENNKYKLSNGLLVDDPINAQLVYYKVDNSLKLAWNYEFYSQNYKHLWFVMVDAINGKLLLKENHTLTCNFERKEPSSSIAQSETTANGFTNSFLKENKSLVFTPGTTNYKVIPYTYESPNHYKLAFPASTDGRTTVTNPEITTFPAASPASPNGWHNASTTIGASSLTYAYTRGNNVFAYTDTGNTNPAAPTTYANASSGTYPSLTFDYAYGGNGVAANTYQPAATTNLFYQNNMMHDIWYQYGFNEANKNFQAANFGRGGTGNDAVNAECQDASTAATPTYNNANFSTPTDGSKPRMQMYLWNIRKNSDLHVNTGTLSGTDYKTNDNAFSPGHVNLPIAPSVLTGTLQLVSDGSPDVSDACANATTGASLAANSMSGKIAVIRRGTCSFALKVKAVQNAGAIAAIVVNNDSANPTARVSMAGSDATITIPAVSMTYADGEALIASMSSGSVSVNLSSPEVFVNADGDFDNGIISHEYGHGISTRLSGNCLGGSEQMGEGWSDWFWMMLQIKPSDISGANPTFADGAGVGARGMGTFAENQATTGIGIREYKYSTNMSENPHTYSATNSMWYTDTTTSTDYIDVHAVGSVWAVILWDLAWNYMVKYGYNSDVLNTNGLNKGNNRVMKLVLDAIKIEGCNPTMVAGRDALIQADVNTTGGQDVCMIYNTFARRGVGQGASAGANSGSVADIQDQVESFTQLTPGATPATGSACVLAVNQFDLNNTIAIYPNPTTGLFTVQISQFEGVADLEIVDINGRVVYTQKNVDFSTEKSINLAHVQSGIYIVKIKAENTSLVKKLIIE